MIDEILDIVNELDEVIGQKPRTEVNKMQMTNVRAVNVFLVNSKGQLWIPRRAAHKKVFPNALDASVGGLVSAGETYEQAFAREVAEEINLCIKTVSSAQIGYCTPHAHNVAAFMKVYEIYTDQAPNFNPEDFTEAFWLYPHEILERLQKGDTSKSDLPKLIKIFYTHKN